MLAQSVTCGGEKWKYVPDGFGCVVDRERLENWVADLRSVASSYCPPLLGPVLKIRQQRIEQDCGVELIQAAVKAALIVLV